MSNTKTVMSQAANTLVKPPVNVEDVFSTYLYTGNGSAQTITNGIDLDGEGGLVWIKDRDVGNGHNFYDTERGATKRLASNLNSAETTRTNGVTSFNANGFSGGNDASINTNGNDYASWTWRKAPKFFDVVTYTGDGTNNRTLSHNLGCEVGFIAIKRYNGSGNWRNYHRSLGYDYEGYFNYNDQFYSGSTAFGSQNATSTNFYVGSSNNDSGHEYVAYLFAHNDGDGEFGPTGDQDIIKCGSYTNSSSGIEVDLGFEPQWLLVKKSSATGNWGIVDNMRGWRNTGVLGDNAEQLRPNLSNAENAEYHPTITPTGFKTYGEGGGGGGSTGTFIYIAIRRGTKVPESGTEAFHIQLQSNGDTYSVGFPNDLLLLNKTGGSSANTYVGSRLTGDDKYLVTSSTAAEGTSSGLWSFDLQDSFDQGASTASPWVGYHWKRAPGYFDAVAYSGVGTAGRTVSHNLGVAPEMMWVKGRNYVENWGVYHKDVGATKYLMLNQTTAESTYTGAWNDTAPTSSVFTLGGWNAVNESGYNYIAYLFATLPGISKVGSYTGTGSDQNIDCGFTSGARFVLIKRYSSTSPWSVFDSVRGITSSTTDPYLFLNSTAAEATDAQRDLDPYSSGFTLAGNDTDINASGSSYIFYAIA